MLIRSVVLWTLYNTTLTRNGRKLLMILYCCPDFTVYTYISHRVIRPHQCAPYRIATCLPRDTENGGKLFVKW